MGSIRRQLVVLLLGMGLVLLALEAWNGVENYRHQVERAQLGVLDMAQATAAATAELLRLSRSSLEGLAGSVREARAEGTPAARACREIVLPAGRALGFLETVGLLDASAELVCATTPSAAGSLSGAGAREWFGRMSLSGEYVVGAPQRGGEAAGWLVALAQPIADSGGGAPSAVVASIGLGTLQDLVAVEGGPKAALLTIVDANGTVLARSRDFASWAGRRLGPEVPAQERVAPGVAITRTEDADGIPTTFARVDIPSTGWRVFAGIPDAVVYRPARRAAARDLIVALPLLLLALALGAWFYRHVASSLRDLVEAVGRAGTHAYVPEEGPDEVRAVARALNRTLAAREGAESAERQAKERYRSILENAVFGIYLSSPDGRILEVNPALAQLLGFDSAEELRAAGMEVLYPDPAVRRNLVDEHMATGKPIRGLELEWRKRDGTPVTVRLNGKIVEGPAHEHLFEVIVEDVTERRALETELRHTQKMEAVGRLAGGVAHDINNVLTAILGHATLLEHRLGSDEGKGDAVEIVSAAQHASALTRRLLAFSRKEWSQPRPLDLSRAVDDTQRTLRRLIGEDVEIVTRLAPGLPPVLADPGQLEQVILNLLLNARDAMPGGGRIEVGTRLESTAAGASRVALEVRDSGPGMASDVRDHIFEPFFTTKADGHGTGLGLSTVYGIVTQAGGTIHVDSEPGVGTSFLVRFPPAAASPAGEGSDAAPGADVSGRGTILLAEDEPSVRDVVRRVLQRAGYRVLPATSGSEALAIAEAHAAPISLFLTDVVMPGMSGPHAADRLATTRPDTPVLFMSGYSESEALRALIEEDPGVLLNKPFTPDELVERVRERLRSGRAPLLSG